MFKEPASRIEREAALWATRCDRGLSPDEEGLLDEWLDADPRRLGAFGRARAMSIHAERAIALRSGQPLVATSNRMFGRRVLLAGGGAIAAGLVAAVFLGLSRTTYATGLGEVRIIALSDGSVVTLDALSEAEIAYDDKRRTVRLINGEALFDVAKDATRPFIVESGRAQFVAVGTSFSVSRPDRAPVRLLVREGLVEVRSRASTFSPVEVSPSQAAVVDMEKSRVTVVTMGSAAVARQLSWRNGQLAFEGEALGDAAARFARYSETRVVVAPDVAEREVAGVFQANDPIGFARAAALAHGLRAHIRDGEVRISR